MIYEFEDNHGICLNDVSEMRVAYSSRDVRSWLSIHYVIAGERLSKEFSAGNEEEQAALEKIKAEVYEKWKKVRRPF